MYRNLRWIADAHATLEYLEIYRDKLPVNPPGGHFSEGDIMLERVEILNWFDGVEFVFEPRLRDNVGKVSRFSLRMDDEAPDPETERDCE